MNFDTEDERDAYYDARAEERNARSKGGCRCFAPGEVPGVCPGQAACPMCADDTEDEGDAA